MLATGQGLSPLSVETVAQLSEPPFSFTDKTFRFNSTCFGGDRYLCLKDQASVQGTDKAYQVGVIDLLDDLALDRLTTRKAEGAMKNPHENVLALRGKNEGSDTHFIQVFNLDNKAKLGEHSFDHEIVFWKWLENRCLVVITITSVYHWFLRADNEIDTQPPTQVFTRAGKLAEDVQVINYSVDEETDPTNIRWCILAGIYLSPSDKKTILGCLQLWSVEKQQQQFLEGHAGCFGKIVTEDCSQEPMKVFSFLEKKNNVSKVYVMDIYSKRGEGRPTPFKAACEFTYPPEHAGDFPIATSISLRHGVVMAATKAGFVMIFDTKTGTRLACERVSHESVFLCNANRRSGGVYLVNKKGALLSVTVNEATIIPYVQANCSDGVQLAASLARRHGYSAADEILTQMFRQAIQSGRYAVAARVAASSKGASLRTASTLQAFKTASAAPGEAPPMSQYFQALLEIGGRLMPFEAKELMRPVILQGRRDLVSKWIQEDKLECDEELGDMVRPLDETLAVKVYARGGLHKKVIQYYVDRDQHQDILSYCKKKSYTSDFSGVLRSMLGRSLTSAVEFTKALLENEPPLMDINAAVDVFVQQNKTAEISGILVDVLKHNKPEQAALQTRLFELNLATNAANAELLFQQGVFTHYDRLRIGQLCERAGLFQRALEHYTDLVDIKRVMMKAGNQLSSDWLFSFCNTMAPQPCVEILTDMIRTNRGNLQAVVNVSVKNCDRLGADNLINMFESVGSVEGLFYFLGSIITFSNDPEVHFKYIEAAAKLNHLPEVERVVKESKVYDPVKVKEFLKAADLSSPKALIYVCDFHNFVEELTEYLYHKGLMNYIETYVTKVNPQAAPAVIITLLDLGCQESFVTEILQSLRGACPIDPLIPEMEKRGRLALILPWMEARIEEGISDALLNNAVAKVYIDTNKNAEEFLRNNLNYDPLEIGRYCEERDPHMAVSAYMRGQCDRELIRVTNKNGLFRLQAKYLVERKDPAIWALVLSPENEQYRRMLIDQVVATALPEATSIAEISTTVRAFSDANVPHELLELLERIVLQKSVGLPQLGEELSKNSSLQNLLLLTAMSAEPSKVMDLINRLDAFDAKEAAELASERFGLHEEALAIYQKSGMLLEALDVMLNKLHDFEGATAFAEKVRSPQVYISVGQAEVEKAESTADLEEKGEWIVKAMVSFGKAEKCPDLKRVTAVAKEAGKLGELALFLKKMRTQRTVATSDFVIDSELAFSLAKTQQWSQLESFLMSAHTTNLQAVGDRIYEEGLLAETDHKMDAAIAAFKGAKIFYSKVPNYSKLASCHLKLKDYPAALEAAKRAGSTKSWTEVALAAVAAGDMKIAHQAGLNIVNHSDHLEHLIAAYEADGYHEELLVLLEAGAATGKGSIGLYTELGVAYAKYRPLKLSDFLKSSHVVNAGRLNIPKLIKTCEEECLWKAVVQLYMSYKEYEQAANAVMQHSVGDHEHFFQILQQINNADLYHKAINYYLEFHPSMINSLLTPLAAKLDFNRVISTFKRHKLCLNASRISQSAIALIQSFLEDQQARANEVTSVVNETLHDLYLDKKDVQSLGRSIERFQNYDQTALAALLEKHELLEMKQLALELYGRNGRYAHAIELAKKFKQFDNAVGIAYRSRDVSVVESLLRFFVLQMKSPVYFAACLQVCHAYVKTEVALELAWLSGYTEMAMPYMINSVAGLSKRIDGLEKQIRDMSKSDRKDKNAAQDLAAQGLVSNFSNLAMLPSWSPSGGSNWARM
eukprot:Blabericola_migrator_1__7731@NODE_394_length_8993_cov_144_363433_g314_i0_p1_GENE_NODE_394_length_8993_cov_144_363433_g314_i0NODE_394_length_8993_cov_144_363433_g314_i0_p1_ORF_typecomplete_len1756_score408_30Clathrin/PF00637_20/57Clathrin/PF00637_20/2_3e12Clathrin/PF00637_20/6_6e16Clathrin/PF00637_20/5_7e13Clathrin/PF00637_20/1_2e25Clathrin/PF00637_20/5e09Clathrin/PF00637_20/2_9e15Clathrin/PF00637_20/4_9e13Clathrin_H_link/PF13838_6/1_7e16Clathrin_H_link/PF13838_6/7_5e03TPR_7/PF13176_6/0_6TPR_7/PF